MELTGQLSPENWMRSVFACKAVQQGGIIRRKKRDIERYVGMDRFLKEVRFRGFRAAENADHVIVFCNTAPFRWITT